MKQICWLFAAALAACGGGDVGATHEAAIAPPAISVAQSQPDLSRVLGLEQHENPTYANSDSLFEKPHGDRWSAYLWAQNAGALPSLKHDPERMEATRAALLADLAPHVGGGFVLARYDYSFAPGVVMNDPWRSAFSNAVVAIGLMHLGAHDAALDYLVKIETDLSGEDEGRTWFIEYLDNEDRVDVMNGHFFAVAAMHEYGRQTGDMRFDGAIKRGLETMDYQLPLMVDDARKCFLYAKGFDACDYGQQRAVNFAEASCAIYEPLCDDAKIYREKFKEWTTQ